MTNPIQQELNCSLGEFRCQAVRTGGAASVSCAHSGGDVTTTGDESSEATNPQLEEIAQEDMDNPDR